MDYSTDPSIEMPISNVQSMLDEICARNRGRILPFVVYFGHLPSSVTAWKCFHYLSIYSFITNMLDIYRLIETML